MDHACYKSLSRRERECLRLVDKENGTGEIATQLKLSASSVDTYIKSARAKLGGITRYAAARELRAFEQDRQSWQHPPVQSQSPPSEGSPTQAMAGIYPNRKDAGVDQGESSWRESTAATGYAYGSASFDIFRKGTKPTPRNGLRAMHRIAVMGMAAIFIAAGMLLVLPLADSFQRLANLIDVPKR